MTDPVPSCANCGTDNPVGGLTRAKRHSGGTVLLCELCSRTVAGQRFLAGGEPLPELVVLAQGLNIIRKDVAALLKKVGG